MTLQVKTQRQPYAPALLVCLRCQHPTVHRFKYGVRERDGRQHITGVATFYECEDCGTERVWGREQPTYQNELPRVVEAHERKTAA